MVHIITGRQSEAAVSQSVRTVKQSVSVRKSILSIMGSLGKHPLVLLDLSLSVYSGLS